MMTTIPTHFTANEDGQIVISFDPTKDFSLGPVTILRGPARALAGQVLLAQGADGQATAESVLRALRGTDRVAPDYRTALTTLLAAVLGYKGPIQGEGAAVLVAATSTARTLLETHQEAAPCPG